MLVFSKTAGFRHDSIPQGIAAIQKLGTENGFTVDATEDATAFTDANLAQYDVIVFMSTTGDILNTDQQKAFERYMHAGGGFAGVHAASDTEYTWPYYGQMLGGYFRNHPNGTPQATIRIEDADEPSTTGIPAAWVRNDEWYNFQKPNNPVVNGNQPNIPDYSPRTSGVHVLATVDESTYDEVDDSAAADDHPIAWCSNFDGGRAWYTGIGHTQATFSEPDALKHLLGGLKTAAKAVDADCGAERQRTPTTDDFEVATLAKGADKIGEPISLDVLPDRRVLHTARDGRVFITTPNSVTSLAAQINVYSHDEDGLQGVAVDPELHAEQVGLPLLRPAPEHAADGRADRRQRRRVRAVQGLQPGLALQARRRQQARPRVRAEDPRDPDRPRPVLPRRRRHGLRRPGQPVRRHGRRLQPVLVRRLRAARRPREQEPGVRRAPHVRQHERPARQGAPDQGRRRTAPTRSRPATCSRPARWAPSPRSTRWASATRSASRSTRRPATSTSASTARTPAPPTRTAARAAWSSST